MQHVYLELIDGTVVKLLNVEQTVLCSTCSQ